MYTKANSLQIQVTQTPPIADTGKTYLEPHFPRASRGEVLDRRQLENALVDHLTGGLQHLQKSVGVQLCL